MTMTGQATAPPLGPGGGGDLVARLAAPRKVIEREFLRMGEQLVASTRLLNQASAAYADMPAALSGPEFAGVVADLQRIPLHAERLKRDNEATQAFLARINDLTRQFPSGIDKLTKAVRLIRMFSISARVVAETNGDRSEEIASFVPEIVRSGDCLAENVQSFANAFARMCDSLEAAQDQSATFSKHHADLLSGIAADVASNLAVMEEQRQWAENQAVTHAARTERIGAGVSKAVGTLQIGDSTRQRVEHVETVLEDLCMPADPETASVLYTLLAAQLDGSVADFDGEIGALADSLGALTQEASAMQQRAMTDAETLLSAGDSAFGTITDSLIHIESVFGQYERGNAALGVAVDQLVATVGNMLDYIGVLREIGQSIRLVSLNASIKTSALGDGGLAFQQVAQELRALNDTITALLAEITAKLLEAESTLREFLEARGSHEDVDPSAIRETLGASRHSIESVTELLRDRTALMAESGPAALTRLEEALASVSERRDFCEDWRAIGAELLARSPHAAPDPANARADIIAEVFKYYTMKAERDIHNAHLGIVAEAPPCPDPDGNDQTGLDGIFF